MCNLYNVTTTREAIIQFTRAFADKAGFNEPSLDVYPGYQAPIVRVTEEGQREIVRATWGMPSPPAFVKNYDPGVTNIRNVSSPHWRRWLGPTSRCVVPFISFAEPDPASKVAGGRVPNAWFAGVVDKNEVYRFSVRNLSGVTSKAAPESCSECPTSSAWRSGQPNRPDLLAARGGSIR